MMPGVDPVVIPLDVDKRKVVTHARRVAALTRALGLAVAGLYPGERETPASVLPVGIALSWAVDLGPDWECGPSTDEIAAAAFPGPGSTGRVRAAIGADVPRYQPRPVRQVACPVGGWGGGCPRAGQPSRWVTDPATGDWQWRHVCVAHQDLARSRVEACPDPVPNRGGILAAVFPDIDLDPVYAWAAPGWTPTGHPVPLLDPALARRVVLRVVRGEHPAGRRAPVRIQRHRTPGWRTPTDPDGRAPVYVGRPTRWGNPHRTGPTLTAAAAVAAYAGDLRAGRLPVTVADVAAGLAGRDLSCWCPPGPCHADVLLDVAAGRTR